jgi:transposase InsO family protein
MSKARLVLTALLVDCQTPAEVAARYGVHRSWVYKLKARYDADGEAALQPRSRRPHTSPTAIPPATVTLITQLRGKLTTAGLDAGPDTIAWHLAHHHSIRVSASTISRYLTRAGLVTPTPKKRPKSSYHRFAATLPNQTWQADFTHYRLTQPNGTPGADAEVLTWLDDHSRYALDVTAHQPVTGPIVRDRFLAAVARFGTPASTLTDNGMVFTTRFAGGKGGRNALEAELRRLGVAQKNARPNHPTTCGKVERFQQTLKKWLAAQPHQPSTLAQLQALLEAFTDEYNQRRPHRSLPHRATPATVYASFPKAQPTASRDADTHDRVRHDRIDNSGCVTLRVAGRLHHLGIGRTHARTHVILLVQDLHVRVVNAATGELLRELVIDPTKDYQPTGAPKGPTRNPSARTHNRGFGPSPIS